MNELTITVAWNDYFIVWSGCVYLQELVVKRPESVRKSIDRVTYVQKEYLRLLS